MLQQPPPEGPRSDDAPPGADTAGGMGRGAARDTGGAARDAGSAATDAGSAATDAGSAATDAGSAATDAGSAATDAGSAGGMSISYTANHPGMPLEPDWADDWDQDAAIAALITDIETGRREIPPEDPDDAEYGEDPEFRDEPGPRGAAASGSVLSVPAPTAGTHGPTAESASAPTTGGAAGPVPEFLDAGFLPHGPGAAANGPDSAADEPGTAAGTPRDPSAAPGDSSGGPPRRSGVPPDGSGTPGGHASGLPPGAESEAPGPGTSQEDTAAGFASGGALDTALPGPDLARLADIVAGDDRSYPGVSDDELIGVLGAWQRIESWAASGKLSAVAELIRRRPPDHSVTVEPGDMPPVWGEFCSDELAAAMKTSARAAEQALVLAHDLATRLHGTCRALREGLIDSYKARIISDATRFLDDAAAAAAEALILGRISLMTPGQLRNAIGRAVLSVDPDAARGRRKQAERDGRVELWREDAGTAALCGFGLPPDEALAADQLISARARELKAAGLKGSMDRLRVRAYLDFLLGKDSASPAERAASHGPHDPADSSPGSPAAPGSPDPASAGPASPDRPSPNPAPPDPATPGPVSPNPAPPGPATSGPTSSGAASYGPAPASPASTGPGPGAGASLAARINLTVPLVTLLGLGERPGEAAGFGAVDADLARDLAAAAARNPATSWCLTVVDERGHPVGHGCARPDRGGQPGRPGHGKGGGPTGTAGASRAGPGSPGNPGPENREKPESQRCREDQGYPESPESRGNPGSRSPGDSRSAGSPADPPFAARFGPGPPGGSDIPAGYGTWRLGTGPGGHRYTVAIGPVPIADCDHRHETPAYQPSERLRHLVEIRDGECTWPPCRRNARRCDFEHTVPWQQGGRTCACNAGPRCRHHHRQKQARGWGLEQSAPGYLTWTTPSGRQYTSGPASYPV